ncbi:MAG: DUF1328 domain-containing protein [Chryseolinea sp.]
MLRFILGVFLTILVVTVFGLGGSLAAGAIETAKILFYTIVTLILLSLMLGPVLFRRR